MQQDYKPRTDPSLFAVLDGRARSRGQYTGPTTNPAAIR
jgi:hypothetical protein